MFKTTLLALTFAAFASAATVVTFNPAEVGGISNLTPVTNQWSSFGITGTNLYFYEDSRDTFDRFGVSRQSNNTPGFITFAAPTPLTIDYFVIGGFRGVYNAFDSADNLVDSLLVDATQGDTLGTYAFTGNNIARLELDGSAGFIQVSTLTFTGGPAIPEPSTMALLAIGVGGLALLRRRS